MHSTHQHSSARFSRCPALCARFRRVVHIRRHARGERGESTFVEAHHRELPDVSESRPFCFEQAKWRQESLI